MKALRFTSVTRKKKSFFPKKKSIAKVNRVDVEELLSDVGIDSIIAPKKVVSNQIIRYVRAMHNSIGSNVEALTRIINDEVEALEFRVVDTFKKPNIPSKSRFE